jgi:hypothetical protein
MAEFFKIGNHYSASVNRPISFTKLPESAKDDR